MVQANRVECRVDHISFTPTESGPFDLETFKKNVELKVNSMSPSMLQFDLVHVPASIANALRRLIIADVPTMAIEKVFFSDNSGVMVDEILAHRVGLIPIHCDPRLFENCVNDEENDLNTAVFDLSVQCKNARPRSKSNAASSKEEPEEEKFINDNVTTAYLEWAPHQFQLQRMEEYLKIRPAGIYDDFWSKHAQEWAGIQQKTLGSRALCNQDQAPNHAIEDPNLKFFMRPTLPDILLTKLRPGQAIKIRCHARKSNGRDHAKHAPVACCTYRLLPEIIIQQPGGVIKGDEALVRKFQMCFAKGVIGLRESTEDDGQFEAYVMDARKDTVSREVLRHPEFRDIVKLNRVRDHFIFYMESFGQYDCPMDIVTEAWKIMANKCVALKSQVDALIVTQQSRRKGR